MTFDIERLHAVLFLCVSSMPVGVEFYEVTLFYKECDLSD